MEHNKKKSNVGRPKDDAKAFAIMEAAGALFMKNGMAGTTMDDVAQAAGVSKLTVYNHFGNKGDLFQSVLRKKCESHVGTPLLEQLTGDDIEQDLIEIGKAFSGIIFSEEAMAMHRVVMSESPKNKDISRLFYEAAPRQVYCHLTTYLQRLEQSGKFHFPDLSRAVDIFTSLFQGDLYLRTLLGLHPKPTLDELEALAQENTQVFLKAFAIQKTP